MNMQETCMKLGEVLSFVNLFNGLSDVVRAEVGTEAWVRS